MKELLIFLAIITLLMLLAWMTYRVQDRELEEWREYIADVCKVHNIRPEIVEAIIDCSSQWDYQKIDGHRMGLMQLSEVWNKPAMDKLGMHDLSDPYDNISVGVHQLSDLYERYKDDVTVLMVFRGSNNAGRIDRAQSTSEWVNLVLDRAEELEQLRGRQVV